ncbi:MAG: EamA family transporter [Alkalibacterium sp.]|nr:EamA family transporter [Alkalibacterium sp.]
MSIGGLGFVIVAAIFWGLSGGLSGFLMDKGWDPLVIAFYRGFIGLICISIWYAFKPTRWNKQMLLWSVVAGLGVAGNFIFYNLSIAEASIAIAATLMYTAPIFVLLISFIFKIEKATLFKWLAILSVMIGVVLMTEVYSVDSDSVTTLGILTGLGAGVSYALFLFGFKYASKHGEPQSILTAAFLTFSLVMLFVIDYGEAVSVITSSDVLWMILLGLVGAGVSFYLYVNGLERTSPTTASVSAMVEPVTASLFGVWVMSEMLNMIQLVGMGVILVTVTVLNVKKE